MPLSDVPKGALHKKGVSGFSPLRGLLNYFLCIAQSRQRQRKDRRVSSLGSDRLLDSTRVGTVATASGSDKAATDNKEFASSSKNPLSCKYAYKKRVNLPLSSGGIEGICRPFSAFQEINHPLCGG